MSTKYYFLNKIPFKDTKAINQRGTHVFKLATSGAKNSKDLQRIPSNLKNKYLTQFSYSVFKDQHFQVSHLIKFLKKSKNLKSLHLELQIRSRNLFSLKPLFTAIGRLSKLKRLHILFDSPKSRTFPTFSRDLALFLEKMASLESLNLEFKHISFHNDPLLRTYTFPFKKLVEFRLSFLEIELDIDQWIIPFSKMISDGISKAINEPKILVLHLNKNACSGLTPLGVFKFLKNFDKHNLTNEVNLDIITSYWQEENCQISSFGDILSLLISKSEKYKLNSLKTCNKAFSQGIHRFIQMKQHLSMNHFSLKILDRWDVAKIIELMELVKLLKPKKTIKVIFPNWIRKEQSAASEYEDSEQEEEEEYQSEEGFSFNLINIVLKSIISRFNRYNNETTLIVDFTDSIFDSQDYELLDDVFANTNYQLISHLNLKLPRENVDNDFYPNMDEEDMVPAMINVICHMRNVKTCQANMNGLELRYFAFRRDLNKTLRININSALEKLTIKMNKCQLKSKEALQMLKIFCLLPKLQNIEVICSKRIYEAYGQLKKIKVKNKKVNCNFILRDQKETNRYSMLYDL